MNGNDQRLDLSDYPKPKECSEFTKGEWIVEHDPLGTFDVEYRTEDGGGLICVCGNDAEAEANARLIAAAPDLLKVAEHFFEWHANHFGEFDSNVNGKLLCLTNEAEAAIAKAKA